MELKHKIDKLCEHNIQFINTQQSVSNVIIEQMLDIQSILIENQNVSNDQLNNQKNNDYNTDIILQNIENIDKNIQDVVLDNTLFENDKDNKILNNNELFINMRESIQNNDQNINLIALDNQKEDNTNLRTLMSHDEIIKIENFTFSEQTQENNPNLGQDVDDSPNEIENKNIDSNMIETKNNDIPNTNHIKEAEPTQLISELKNAVADILHKPSINQSPEKNRKTSENEEEMEDYLNVALLDDIIYELKNHPDIGIVVDKDGIIFHQNNSFVSRLKFTSTECINTDIKTLIHFDDHDLFSDTFQNMIDEIEANIMINNHKYENNNRIQFKPIIINISDKFKNFTKFKLSFESSNINSITMIENNKFQIKIRLLKQLEEENYQYICPKSSYYFVWSIILLLILVQIIWDSSYKISFDSIIINETNIQIDQFITITFLFDLIQNFFVGYETTNDVIETKNETIIQNYLTTYFITDLISTIPFKILYILHINIQKLEFVKYARVFKLFRLAKIQHTISSLYFLQKNDEFIEIAKFIKSNVGYIELLKVLSFLLISTHFYTCIQFQQKTVILENQSLKWTSLQFNYSQEKQNAINIQLKVQSEMLKTSLGLNLVQASEPLEFLMDTFWITIGLCIQAYGIGNISSYLTNANKRQNELNETLKFFRELQEDHQCEYLGKLIENDINDQQDNYSINEFNKQSQMLSENIKTQIDNAIYSSFIKLNPIFSTLNLFSIKKLKQSKIKTDKQILRSNEVMNSIQLVLNGSIKVMNINLCMINEQFTGEIFGMNHFTEQQSKKFNIDINQFLKADISKKNRNKSYDEIAKLLKQKLTEKINDTFLMIQNNIIIKCEYYAICTPNSMYMEIDYKILEEILKSDLDSFRHIQNLSLKSFELINENEHSLSKLACGKFESSEMIGIMIKSNGQIYDLNLESRKQIGELGSIYHDINLIKCLHKIEKDGLKSISDIDEIKVGKYIFQIEQAKQHLELIIKDEVKIARTDIDNPFQKLKKSLQNVRILYFNQLDKIL